MTAETLKRVPPVVLAAGGAECVRWSWGRRRQHGGFLAASSADLFKGESPESYVSTGLQDTHTHTHTLSNPPSPNETDEHWVHS